MIESAKPLFLIGAPRSGTTILCKLLNAHPEILLTNETAVFLQLSEMIQKSRMGVRAGILYGKAYHKDWADLLADRSAGLIAEYYERIAEQEGRKKLTYWGEKHPHLNACLPMLADLYPEAHYVYAIRDPRDSACSIAEMNRIPPGKALETWSKFTQTYEAFVESLPPERCTLVRYEDFVQDYVRSMESVLEALGLGLDHRVLDSIENNKDHDSHQGGDSRNSIDFRDKSYMRWKRDMSDADREYALTLCKDAMDKYGYAASGVIPLSGNLAQPSRERYPPVLQYRCNICGAENHTPVEELERERRSCASCGSSVRTRSIVHLLSLALYGESRELAVFTADKKIRGIGLSDWKLYADQLKKKFGYTNTFFHQAPRFDVVQPEQSDFSELDFLIATEVFEHVVPPVQRAFDGAYRALKDGGWLILTVPYMNRIEESIEHFPELHDYKVEQRDDGSYVLENTTADGQHQTFNDLRFHGGPGETLEMRIFARDALLGHLEVAGFSEVRILSDDCAEHGILWKTRFSLPILARK